MKGISLKTFIVFALAGLSGAALLHTSQSVQHSEEVLAQTQKELAHEEEAMRVLRAEWEYLNRPARLERLASEFLDLVPPTPENMPDDLRDEAASLPDRVGTEGEAQSVSYEGYDQ